MADVKSPPPGSNSEEQNIADDELTSFVRYVQYNAEPYDEISLFVNNTLFDVKEQNIAMSAK